MFKISRQSNSPLGSWWWTVDRLTLGAVFIIVLFSAIMVATTSPAVAERIGIDPFYFIRRQLVYLVAAMIIVTILSIMPSGVIKKISLAGLVFCLVAMVLVLVLGDEVKGAKRWLTIAGFSLQPSEFIKPFFIIVVGWVLSIQYVAKKFPAFKIVTVLYLTIICLLILQPDFGMVVTVSAVWAGQLFLAGLSIVWIVAFLVAGVVGITSAYIFLPHVALRINNFLDPSSGDNYQIRKSISALMNGGFYGRGPGEGTVKQHLPDSHTDFIFAVIGEELGLLVCIVVIALFAFIVFRGFIRVSDKKDLFTVFAVSGLLMQFGIQAIINMGVTMHLFPTKGMTLPFISYGGSSMMAVSIAVGIMLSLTRKRYGVRSNTKFIEIP